MSSSLLDRYAQGPGVLRKAVAGMSREQLLARPVAGRWSTLEVVCHVADAEVLYAERVKRILAEDRPTVMVMDPDAYQAALAYHDRDVEEELNLVEAQRKQLAHILAALPSEVLEREGIHSVTGPFTAATALQRVTDHLEHHVQFIEEKRRALGLS